MNNPVTEGIEKLLTVQDLMDTLRISRPTLYRMLKAGQLKPVRIGKRTLFDPADIRGLIQEAKTGKKPRASQGKRARDQRSAPIVSRKRKTSPLKEAVEKPKRSKKKPPDDEGKQGRLL
jgi:excisionase family DNA binding protein